MSLVKSLHGKIIIGAGIIISAVLMIFAFMYSIGENQELEQFHIEQFDQHTETIMEWFADEMANGGMDSVRSILIHESHDPDISDITLFNSQGQIVISTSGLEARNDLPLDILDSVFKAETRYSRRQANVLSIVKAIGNSPRCNQCHPSEPEVLGYFEVDFRFDSSEGLGISYLGYVFGCTIFFMIILATSLWFFQNHFIHKPIASLMNAIQRAKDGDLTVQAGVWGSDEISSLTINFNELITRLDKAQKELIEFHAQKMENAERLATAGELASGIAHEIKNPLAGISSTIQVMLENKGDFSPNKDILSEMAIQIKRIEKAVKDLLSYACPPAPEFSAGDLNEDISRCVSFVSSIAEKQGTKLSALLDNSIPTVLLDSTLIDQVIMNTLMNSLQALGEGGEVSVTSEFVSRDRIAVITITDDGPGIPIGVKDKVFRPFYTTKHKGSGLGLSICKTNIERHLGTIEILSTPDKKTSFIIRIPVDTTLQQLRSRLEYEKEYFGSR
jgi:signal transduction histidine kinase